MLASLSTLIEGHSQWAITLLFTLVALESLGLPVPGETALVVCSVLASQGTLSIVSVIVAATTGAIVGDNAGYLIARTGGRSLLERLALTRRYAERYLPKAERFFRIHGAAAVFIGRFVAFLRVTVAWAAGLSRMPWRRFLAWNAAGAAVWATTVALITYYLGEEAVRRLGTYGLVAAGTSLVVGTVAYLTVRRVAARHRAGQCAGQLVSRAQHGDPSGRVTP
jgi:membrane protein DedA with SNARE-associated domain